MRRSVCIQIALLGALLLFLLFTAHGAPPRVLIIDWDYDTTQPWKYAGQFQVFTNATGVPTKPVWTEYLALTNTSPTTGYYVKRTNYIAWPPMTWDDSKWFLSRTVVKPPAAFFNDMGNCLFKVRQWDPVLKRASGWATARQ